MTLVTVKRWDGIVGAQQLPSCGNGHFPRQYITLSTTTALLFTPPPFFEAPRVICRPLCKQNGEIKNYLDIQQLVVLPDDHLCGFTSTNNDLSLELVALGHAKLFHGTDGSLFHV